MVTTASPKPAPFATLERWLLSLPSSAAYPRAKLRKFGKLASWRLRFAGSRVPAMTSAPVQSESTHRMTRVRVEVPLRFATLAPAPLFAEETHTLVVNPQGCGVKLSRALDPGTRVLLDGLPGGAQVTARVANCLPLGTDGRLYLLGLALDTPGNVWGIAKPPADWRLRAARFPFPRQVVLTVYLTWFGPSRYRQQQRSSVSVRLMVLHGGR